MEGGSVSSEADLGCPAEDVVTGFEGIITGRVRYLTGCAQLLLTPRVKDGGQKQEPLWFDETRVRIEREPALRVVLPATSAAAEGGPDIPAPVR